MGSKDDFQSYCHPQNKDWSTTMSILNSLFAITNSSATSRWTRMSYLFCSNMISFVDTNY